jgi:hypothetical protein
MKRDYLGHAVTLALAIAASAVINAKCPPDPVPAGKPAPEKAPEVEAPKAVPVAPVVVPVAPVVAPTPEVKAEGRGL